jgi:hypothetical protein
MLIFISLFRGSDFASDCRAIKKSILGGKAVSDVELFYCTDKQQAVCSQELQGALTLVEFSKMCFILVESKGSWR